MSGCCTRGEPGRSCFRADVAQAKTAPQQWGRFQASKQLHSSWSTNRAKLSSFTIGKEAGSKRRGVQGKKESSESLPTEMAEVEFLRGVPGPFKLRLTSRSERSSRFPAEFAAALGGERR